MSSKPKEINRIYDLITESVIEIEEAIEKIRKANLGKKSSIETRKKLKGRKNHFYIDGRCNDKKKYNREWMKKFRKIPKNKIDGSISGNIWHSLKEKKNGRHWEDLVGYTLQDLMKHLENLFDENMNWENYGSYWEIDHKTPKSWFRYEIAEDLEFKKCWALENLQPLEISLNRSKKNYYEEIVVKV